MLDRVAVAVTAPRDPSVAPDNRWADPKNVFNEPVDRILDAFEEDCRRTFFGGLASPVFYPNFGPDAFSAFLGVPMHYSEDSKNTSWIDWKSPLLADFRNPSSLAIRDDNVFYRKSLEYYRKAVQRGKNRYITGITDLHGGFDSLCVLRGGPDVAVMDMVDDPDGVRKTMKRMEEVWLKIYNDYWAVVNGKQPGSDTWMHIYAPGKMYPVQNDLSCLVSAPMYREFFLEELLTEIAYLDYSIYHLDGVEALQHLDLLLDIPRLNAIQWVMGARNVAGGIKPWIPLYQKIQAKKKAIVVYPKPEELDLVLEHLQPEGLLIQMGCASEEEAKTVLARLGWK